jgi:transcriptional regulator with PAS, ATPase and Fis domain
VFEHAHGGTLFLDEAGELPLALQPKLLRAVEYGEIQRVGSLETRKLDVSVVAATNRNLRAEIDAGRFRRDLYYRLSILEIYVPPLRERREDIPYLAAAFIRDISARFERPITGLTPAAEKRLQEAPWPGNVRELRNAIERACLLSHGGLLTERDFATAHSPVSAPLPDVSVAADDEGRSDLLSTAQREQIRRVLRETQGNKAAAAKLLGVSRRSLYRWLDRLDIDDPQPS